MTDRVASSISGSVMTEASAAAAFAVLGSDIRLAILRHLVRAGEGGLPVGALQSRLGIAGSTLSHHLRAMTQSGLVVQERDGRTLNCHADFRLVSDLATFLLEECCAEAPAPHDKVSA